MGTPDGIQGADIRLHGGTEPMAAAKQQPGKILTELGDMEQGVYDININHVQKKNDYIDLRSLH